jgi:hypothetical protein
VSSAVSHKAVTYKMLSRNRRFLDRSVKTVPIEKLYEVYHFPEEEIYRTIISAMIAAAISVPRQ